MTPPKIPVTGIPELDSEHDALAQILVELGRRIDKCCPQGECRAVISTLVAAIRDHFSHEEEHMTRDGYAQLRAHAEEHKHFLGVVESLERTIQDGTIPADRAVLAFLWDWLNEHIDSTDRRYADYVLRGK